MSSILDHGGSPNEPDNSAAFRRCALNGNGVVEIPRGRFRVKSDCRLPPGVDLEGSGTITAIGAASTGFPNGCVVGNYGAIFSVEAVLSSPVARRDNKVPITQKGQVYVEFAPGKFHTDTWEFNVLPNLA